MYSHVNKISKENALNIFFLLFNNVYCLHFLFGAPAVSYSTQLLPHILQSASSNHNLVTRTTRWFIKSGDLCGSNGSDARNLNNRCHIDSAEKGKKNNKISAPAVSRRDFEPVKSANRFPVLSVRNAIMKTIMTRTVRISQQCTFTHCASCTTGADPEILYYTLWVA